MQIKFVSSDAKMESKDSMLSRFLNKIYNFEERKKSVLAKCKKMCFVLLKGSISLFPVIYYMIEITDSGQGMTHYKFKKKSFSCD